MGSERAPFPFVGFRNGVFYDLMTGEGVREAFPDKEAPPPPKRRRKRRGKRARRT